MMNNISGMCPTVAYANDIAVTDAARRVEASGDVSEATVRPWKQAGPSWERLEAA